DPAVKFGQFINAGLVQKRAGAATSVIRSGNASLTSSGVIDVQTGTVMLTGHTIGITGLIKGAGTIQFGLGTATLAGAASITTAGWPVAGAGAHVPLARSLGYAGAFSASIGSQLTIGAADILTLSGAASFFRDTVDGAGRLTTKGGTTVNLATL